MFEFTGRINIDTRIKDASPSKEDNPTGFRCKEVRL
jgi:hypothetical protein